jgi:ParB-like chromosome segregation protein Spo0J
MAKKKPVPMIHEMEFEVGAIDSVEYHPENPRQGDVGAICESLDANGFFGAILVQKSRRRIIAGAHRHKSMKASGGTLIPMLILDVDDEKALDILLADNATADQADYDRAALPALLQEIHERRRTLRGTGFNEEQLQQLLDDLNPPENQKEKQTETPTDKAPPNLDPGEDRYQEQYGVIVICKSEAEQQRVFTSLSLEYDHVKVVVT